MLTVERTSVMNFENAIRGARNPLNSWGRMDSVYDENGEYELGPNDLSLAMRLAHAGSDHRKFLRQIKALSEPNRSTHSGELRIPEHDRDFHLLPAALVNVLFHPFL